MASTANAFSIVNAVVWATDKCRISTGTTAVTYTVQLAPGFTDTLFSAAVNVPANSTLDFYVGVGNRITVVGSGFTALELGTASSGTAGH